MKKKITLILLSIICTFSIGLGVFSAMQKSVKAEEIGFSSSVYYQSVKIPNQKIVTFEATVNLVEDSGRQVIASNYSGNNQADQFDFEIHTGGKPRIFYSYWHPGGGASGSIFENPAYQVSEAIFGLNADKTAVDIRGKGDVKVIIVVDLANKNAYCWINGTQIYEEADDASMGLNVNLNTSQVQNTMPFIIGNDYRRSDNLANPNNVIKNVTFFNTDRTSNVTSDSTNFVSSGTGVICAYDLQGKGGAKNIKDLSGNGYDLKLAERVVYEFEESDTANYKFEEADAIKFNTKGQYYKTLAPINSLMNTVEAWITVPEGGCGRGVIWVILITPQILTLRRRRKVV